MDKYSAAGVAKYLSDEKPGVPGAANFYSLRLRIGAVQEGNFQGSEKSGARGELPSDAGSTAPT
jgi:hypothetical protein